MARLVQKYGGTSVREIDRIKSVAEKIKTSYIAGNEMIVVVSARAGVTNELIDSAKQISSVPTPRELDVLLCTGEQETVALLSIALNSIGVPAVSRLSFQAEINTSDSYGNARVISIDGGDIEELISKNIVVVVAGFQGITSNGQLTTLGRGGSDLTALALAHRFHADRCEIFTDVDGVFTGDPNIVEHAKIIKNIDFESLLRLSFFGNKVMQDRSIAFAQRNDVPFSIHNSKKMSSGTSVTKFSGRRYESCVIGITSKTNICLLSCESETSTIYDILKFFKSRGVDITFIKHRLISDDSFFSEVCIDQPAYEMFQEEFFLEFSKNTKKFSVLEKLSRIDIVGTNVQSDDNVLSVFDVMKNYDVVRSEYGKHGLSFLVRTNNYQQLLNAVHDIVFKEHEINLEKTFFGHAIQVSRSTGYQNVVRFNKKITEFCTLGTRDSKVATSRPTEKKHVTNAA